MKMNYTEEDLIALADAFTCTAESEAEAAALKAWNEPAESGSLKIALDYIESRRKDLSCGYCSSYVFTAEKNLFKVLAHDFNYTFNRYEWDGKTFDPDQADAFDCSLDSGRLEPQASLKEEVVKAFEAYLTEGAAQAKAIESDTYLMWRKALVDCVFVHHRFSFGCEAGTLESYLQNIKKAAQLMWADLQIFNQMKKVSRHKRIGGGKQGKRHSNKKGGIG